MLGVIAFLVLTALAVYYYPNYNYSGQFLSELGIGEKSSFWFNSALILSGVFFTAFFSGFFKSEKISSILGIAGSIALICLALFPFSQPETHNIAAGAFFALTGLAIIAFSAKRIGSKNFIPAFGILAFLSDVFFFFQTNPLTQKLTLMLFLAWVAAFSMQATVEKKQ